MKDYFIVGDVHGCYYTLQNLLKRWKPTKHQLIFVGDIIDHGNHSPQVAAHIQQIQKKHKDTIVLRGNHEQLFLDHCLNGFNDDWYEKSGERTFSQYLIEGRSIDADANWFASFPVYFETPVLIVTHAGVPDGKDVFNPENKDGVVWHRNEIIKLEQLQVYGHTPQQEAIYNASFHAINIDTGAYKCNKLTALIVDAKGEIKDLINEKTHENDLPVEKEECLI